MHSSTFRNLAVGVLALTLAYAAGHQSAQAQSPSFRVLPSNFAVETGGQVFLFSAEHGWVTPSQFPPIAPSSVIAGAGDYMTSDGTVWHMDGYTGAWNSYPLPLATNARHTTFGAIHTKYSH